MKVVINREYGGFGLSDEAVKRCVSLGMTSTKFISRNKLENPKADFIIDTRKNYYGIVDICKKLRCNPILVQVVQELGKAANGGYADLCIMDIPFDTTNGWHIEEYDGYEWIAEDHRTWGK